MSKNTERITETYTLTGPSTSRNRIKGSVFVAIATPLQHVRDSEFQLKHLWKENHDATHICWARRNTPDTPLEQYSDAGEPFGTAGLPILNAIRSANLWMIQISVIRWYGGTKLGTSGLVKAYGETAHQAILQGMFRTIRKFSTFEISVAFSLQSAVFHLLQHYSIKMQPPCFDETTMKFDVQIPSHVTSKFYNELIETTRNQIEIRQLSEFWGHTES